MSCRTPGVVTLVLCALIASACTQDGPTSPATARPLAAVSLLTACTMQYQLTFDQWWPCNASVSIGTDGSISGNTIDDAIGAWRSALHWDELGSVPHLVYSTASTLDIEVERASASADGLYCGTNDPTSSIVLYGQDAQCQSQRLGGAYAVLVHELGEVLGLSDGFEGGTATLGALDCTIRTKDITSLNSTPCAQEVEYIFAGYGLTTIDINNIWNQTIVKSLRVSTDSISVEVGQSSSNSVASITVDPPGTPATSASVTQATFNWISRNTSIATVSPASGGRTASIHGISAGTTYIRAVATGTTVSNWAVGTVARLLGDSVKVVVPPPPPAGTNFRVSDITGPPVPITEAGVEGLHAVVLDPYNQYFQVKWDIYYSNGSHAAVHSDYYPSPNYTLQVPAGSYKITVTATARSEGHYKSHTSYFPVCTGSGGGGGDLLRAQLPDSQPDAGTDAVGGC